MEQLRQPYKRISKIPFWKLILKLTLLAGFMLASSICLLEIIKGLLDLLGR